MDRKIPDAVKTAQAFLLDRQRAYQKVFDDNVAVVAVLDDLKNFCRAEVSCFDTDPRLHAMLEGRREVYLRIKQHLNLSQEALWNLYRGAKDHG